MSGGFGSGLFAGGFVSVVGAAAISLLTPLPPVDPAGNAQIDLSTPTGSGFNSERAESDPILPQPDEAVVPGSGALTAAGDDNQNLPQADTSTPSQPTPQVDGGIEMPAVDTAEEMEIVTPGDSAAAVPRASATPIAAPNSEVNAPEAGQPNIPVIEVSEATPTETVDKTPAVVAAATDVEAAPVIDAPAASVAQVVVAETATEAAPAVAQAQQVKTVEEPAVVEVEAPVVVEMPVEIETPVVVEAPAALEMPVAVEAPAVIAEVAEPAATTNVAEPTVAAVVAEPVVQATVAEPTTAEVMQPAEVAVLEPEQVDMPEAEEPVVETPVVEIPVAEPPAVEAPKIETTPALPQVIVRQPASNAIAGNEGFGSSVGITTDNAASIEEPTIETNNALLQYAIPFENPSDKPLMAIVLLDVGEDGVDGATLTGLNFPLTMAVDVGAASATGAATAHSAAGFEVLAMAPTNENKLEVSASAADIQTVLTGYFSRVPGAVGLVDALGGDVQKTPKLAAQVIEALFSTGHGLVTYDIGLNSTDKKAKGAGLKSGVVFRVIDANLETDRVLKRYLDRAVLEADRESVVIVLGRSYPETVAAIADWVTSTNADRVALAPISAIMLK